MNTLKVVVLSGGTGNTAIVNGILSWYPNCDLKIIVNAYDDGKSTGICRKVVDTLGVSDVRKNHEKLLKIKNPFSPYLDLYSARVDLPKGKEAQKVKEMLKDAGANDVFLNAVDTFFNCETAHDYEYKNFNVMNIVYSGIWKTFGYGFGNAIICEEIGIENTVLLNSTDNVVISAKTKKGLLLEDEGSIVDFANPNDRIKKIKYSVKSSKQTLNKGALQALIEADLVIISTGTFWSSLLPTIEYGKMYQYLNRIKAKKIWILNSAEDKDSYGVNPPEFVDIAAKIGLNISQWNIISNTLAPTSFLMGEQYNLGYHEGKNEPELVARAIFDTYYAIPSGIERVLVDFDGTIYERNEKLNRELLVYLQNPDFVTIISGNSVNHIKSLCGKDFILNTHIWADANSELLVKGKPVKYIRENRIRLSKAEINEISKVKTPQVNNYYIKYRPITFAREEICDKINEVLEEKFAKHCLVARCTGKTTIDILRRCNNKAQVYYAGKYYHYKTLYIGDEIDKGNDRAIASLCDYSINVNNPTETTIIFRLLK